VNHVAVFKDSSDRPRRIRAVVDLHHRLVEGCAGPSFLLCGISISCNCLTALPGYRFGGLNWLHKTA
jgi:hypothetical protein